MKQSSTLFLQRLCLLALPIAVAVGVPATALAEDVCKLTVPPEQAAVEAFLQAECYKSWAAQEPPVHLSGAQVNGVFYTRHQYIQVYYSPEVAQWLERGRSQPLPDGAAIVALEYAQGADTPGALERILSKVKYQAGAHDGWFWSDTSLVDPDVSKGQFGAPSCLACHGSADNPELTFLGPEERPATDGWKPDRKLKWKKPPEVTQRLPQPLAAADQGFLDYFGIPNVPASEVVPFPPKKYDHVVAGNYAGPDKDQQHTFVTSDQCMGCHNASQLLSNTTPNLWYANPGVKDADAPHRNYSPYGEWSASMNGLAGRDPVWHAQVETERVLRPHLANFTDDVCFSCHGPMGGRQLDIDTGDPASQFTIDMFYALPGDPHAKYGALARDGVSCAVCHNIAPDDLGVDPDIFPGFPRYHIPPAGLNTYTALFRVASPITMWGPYQNKRVHAAVMDQTVGMSAQFGEHTREAKLCGSCHIVLVPALPVGYEGTDPMNDEHLEIAFEQTTYWEWRNSVYQNEHEPKNGKQVPAPCQVCHMHPHKKHRIANFESDRFPPTQARLDGKQLDIKEQNPLWRHTLMGINLPVFNMYMQFPEVLGSQLHDPTVPEETVNSMLTTAEWMADFARDKAVNLEVLETAEADGNLEAKIQVTNLTGHKVPTGAGFRRTWVRFRVLDENGKVLWVSGEASPYGVILGGEGQPLESEMTLVPEKSQPHHQEITSQDQVQIYEARALDSEGNLQTTVLGIFDEYKDNRLLPIGWDPAEGPNIYAMRARLPSIHGRLNPDNIILNEQGRAIGRKNDNCDDGYDPDYCEVDLSWRGQDHYVYRIPLADIPGWSKVEAQMFYQTIPPYFLADKFRQGKKQDGSYGRDMKRLIHIVSRLNFKDSAVEDWRVKLGAATAMGKGEPQRAGLSYEEAVKLVKAPSY